MLPLGYEISKTPIKDDGCNFLQGYYKAQCCQLTGLFASLVPIRNDGPLPFDIEISLRPFILLISWMFLWFCLENQVTTFNGIQYYFSTTKKNWHSAENDCVYIGGHLTSIHSQAEYDFIKQQTQNRFVAGFYWKIMVNR